MMFGMVAQDEARAKATEIKQNAEDEATKIRDELLEEARFIGSDSKAEAKLIVRTFPIARAYIHVLIHVCISLSLARARALSLTLFERHHRSSKSCVFVCTHSFAYSWTMQQRREGPSSRPLQDKVGSWNSEPSNRCVTSFIRLRALGYS